MLSALPVGLRGAVRSLVRDPAFTASVVATLALGVGATTAVFTVVDRVVLRPLPYPAAERLVAVWETADHGETTRRAAPANFLDWRRDSCTLPAMAAWRRVSATLTAGDRAVRITVAEVSPSFFGVLEVGPARGRDFTPEGSAGGAEVILSHSAWAGRFGGDPGVVGRDVVLDGQPATVVGVAAPEMTLPDGAELWWREADGVPGSLPPETRDAWYFGVVARRAPGASSADAEAEMAGIAEALARAHPESNRGTGVRLVPLLDDQVGALRPLLLLMLAAAGMVLLVACANVASLLLARAAGRTREMAVRAALGARSRHLVARTLADVGLLAALGGVLGTALAWVGTPAVAGAVGRGLPRAGELEMDLRILAFAALATVGSLVVASLGPAILAARATSSPARGGRDGAGGGRAAHRARRILVGAEVAVGLAVVAGASLVLRTGMALRAVEPGFEPEGLLSLGVAMPAAGDDPRGERTRAWESLLGSVAAVPGVRSVAVAQAGPTGDGWGAGLKVEGRTIPSREEMDVAWQVVGAGYFATTGVRILRGRGFDVGDRDGSVPVGVVSAALAGAVWPGQDPLGRRLRVGLDGPDWVTVVGVAADTRNRGPTAPSRPALYRPLAQRSAWPADEALLLVRHGDAPGVAEAVRAAVVAARPDAPLLALRSGRDLLGEHTARATFAFRLLGVFAVLALVLGGVGVYGVASSMVAERVGELAVRRALGADAPALAGLVLRSGFAVVGGGLAAGAVAALAAGRVLEGLLFGVGPADPIALGGAAAALALAALAAMAGPAWRAARVEPARALRG